MNRLSRLEAIRGDLRERGIDVLIAMNDGSHYSGADDPLFVITGFRALDESAAVVRADGRDDLIVTPAWDAERAAERAPSMRVTGAGDLIAGLRQRLKLAPGLRIGLAGLSSLPQASAEALGVMLGRFEKADALVADRARAKCDEEIEHARIATRIAEQGYERMLELAKPGVREDELAVELRWTMKSLGAEDNFFMLNAGPHNRAVQPCSSRRFEKGDFILTELSPLYRGQMTQICRTIVVGGASEEHKHAYGLLKRGFEKGLEAAKPGAPMSDVCDAVDAVMQAEGYAEYSGPPWMRLRRRGHGLGLGSNLPGDVGPENKIPLEPGMVFVLHPNQYLPQTGYMMCGEPVLITAEGGRALSAKRGVLGEVA